ncbi:MAG: hemerythrin domain-containing protein [Caulobacteraceae bacterium]
MTSASELAADLPLPTRTGLPSSIAYLRDIHPQAQWPDHANYGEMAAFWLQVHNSLREHAWALALDTDALREGRLDAAGFQRRFVPRYNNFIQHLAGHHQIEDTVYFPRFRALDPRMVAGFDLLEHDHGLIHQALLASLGGAQGVMAALAEGGDAQRQAIDAYGGAAERLLDLLLRHLADEEDLVIPAILEHGERSIA